MKDWRFIFEKWVLRKHRPPPFEPKVKWLMKKAYGEVFVDIGCNTGIYSRIAKKRFSRVYSIDPNPKYHAPMQFALSNYNGVGTFYLGNGIGSADSLVHNPHILREDWIQKESYQVNVRTFDSLNLDADLVKIDVEGAEFEVIDGMNKYLPKMLIVELHDERREAELLNVMSRKGYTQAQIDDTHWLFQAINNP